MFLVFQDSTCLFLKHMAYDAVTCNISGRRQKNLPECSMKDSSSWSHMSSSTIAGNCKKEKKKENLKGDCKAYCVLHKRKNRTKIRRATRRREGGGLPYPFLKIKKSALIWEKNALIVFIVRLNLPLKMQL